MQRVLTDKFLQGLKAPAKGRIEIVDGKCSGLVFRLTAAGSASFAFRYRVPATRATTRATIGKYPKPITLKQARALADDYREKVGAGIDPAASKRDARTHGAGRTFGALAERYMVQHARRKKRSHKNDERNLRLHVLPKWRARAFASITRRDAITLLEGIVSDGKLVLVNRVQSLISKIFNFAVDSDDIPHNPIFRLARRGVERAGKRVLSDAEIRLFWRSAVEAPIAEPTGQALRLSLLTGARIGEVAGIRRAELDNVQDASAALWIIPGERTKNGLPHAVPLAPMARAIVLDRLGTLGRDEQCLFPSRTRAGAPLKANTLSNAMGRLAEHLGGGDSDVARSWRAEQPSAHDLRRTFATRMASLGIPKEIRDRLLNHSGGGRDTERQHYNVYEFVSEKRAALSTWDAALTAILSDRPATVVPISKGRRRDA